MHRCDSVSLFVVLDLVKGGSRAVVDQVGAVARRRRRYRKAGELTYNAVHVRLAAERGPASGHRCADCDAPATDWSYNNADPAEITDRATGCPYSLDPAHYRPRCRSCHRRVDWARRHEGRPALDLQQCLMHYRDGLSLAAIGRMFGHTSADVRALLVEAGEPIRARSAKYAGERKRATSC